MKAKNILTVVFVIIILILVYKACDKPLVQESSSTQSKSKSSSEWYKGGTLHKATILEWKSATYRNKLATCGDFVYTADKSVKDLDLLKYRAEQLVDCINEATRDLNSTNDMKVSDIAATCTVLLEYKKF